MQKCKALCYPGTSKGCLTLQAKINKVTEQQQSQKQSGNTDKRLSHSDSRDCPLSNTRRESIGKTLSEEALADFWSRLAHGIVSTGGLYLAAQRVCVCVHIYIYAVYHRKKQTVFFFLLFFSSCLPLESLFCVFPKAQEKESTQRCNNNNTNNDNKRKLSTQQRDDKLVDS